MNINSLDIDYIKFETAIECLEHEPEDTIDYEIIEKAEETRPEYEEKLKERLTKEIKSFCE